MNKFFYYLFISIGFNLDAQIIINPKINYQDAKSIELNKIELEEDGVYITMTHTAPDEYENGGYVRIAPEIFIRVPNNNTKYKLLEADKIPLSPEKHNYSKNGEKLTFTLVFEKIPTNTQSIDIIECENEQQCFNFYGVRLDKSLNTTTITKEINSSHYIKYYNKDFFVVNSDDKEEILYQAIYELDNNRKVIDFVQLYDFKTDKLISKFEAIELSNKASYLDIIEGERFLYDDNGFIRKRFVYSNPSKIGFLDLLKLKRSEEYTFDQNGNLISYENHLSDKNSVLVEYKNNEIVYAKKSSDKFYFEINNQNSYDKVYREEFVKENLIFNWVDDSYSNGSRTLINDAYIMESKNNGGLTDIFEVDFDLNQSDWTMSVDIDRLNSLEGAGITFGSSRDANSFQTFLISGDNHFNYYNIYNSINISAIKDYVKTKFLNYGNRINGISILKIKNQIIFSINGNVVYQTEFTNVPSNTIGLFTDKINNKIKYDNFIIKQLNVSLPVYIKSNNNEPKNTKGFIGNGTGFFINNMGFIATNYHVIEDSKEIYVTIKNKDYKCSKIALDKTNDLAIIKVLNFPSYKIGYTLSNISSETGTSVFTLGYPYALNYLGSEIKLTDGIISSKSGYKNDLKTYQISVPIQPGNSGGPLFDQNGNVVGIVNAGFTLGDNVGYSIKVKYLLDLLSLNKISFSKVNTIQKMSFVEKVKELSKSTLLIKIK